MFRTRFVKDSSWFALGVHVLSNGVLRLLELALVVQALGKYAVIRYFMRVKFGTIFVQSTWYLTKP